MNKPITTRVQQAVNGNRGVQEPLLHVGVVAGNAAKRKGSPLKKNDKPSLGGMFEGTTKDIPESLSKVPTFQTYSAGKAVTDSEEEPIKEPTETKKESTGANSTLIDNESKVKGEPKKIKAATEINAEEERESEKPGFTGSTSIGAAIQRNMAARIDKAGELGRARRDARRAKRSGDSVEASPSTSSSDNTTTTSSTPSTSSSVRDTQEEELINKLDTKGALGAPIQMRMNANVGVKSKSPMKKGYFKGM